ncbi:MAG: hypothetical protein U9Q19_05460 [Pseudomonadota bacterium]|nr:hypothetical protein [Pseudomonadota bacterium]
MRLLSKVRQKAVRGELEKGTYYQHMLDGGYNPDPMKPKKSYSAAEIVAGELNRRRPDNIPLRWTRFDEYLNEVGNVGLFQILRNRFRTVRGRAVYSARCRCGVRVPLTAQEIVARNRKQLGCCSVTCTAVPMSTQIYHCPEVAIRLQLSQLMARRGAWIGDRWKDNLGHATMWLIAELGNRVDMVKGNWWLTDVKQYGLNEVKDIHLGVEPDKWIFPSSGIVVLLEKKLLSLEDAAEAFGVGLETVLRLRIQYYDTELIDNLIGEKS